MHHYIEVLRIAPQAAEMHNNLGTMYMQIDEIDKAVVFFQKAIVLNPKDFRAMSNLAVCFIQKGNYQEAERLLRNALSVNENFHVAKQNLDRLLSENSGKKEE